MKRFVQSVSVIVAVVAGTTAFAQSKPIPKEFLELDKTQCLQTCRPNASEPACEALCSCTVSEFQKRMNVDQYWDLRAEISRNELTPEHRQFLDTVANFCVAQLDKAGIPVGDGTANKPGGDTQN